MMVGWCADDMGDWNDKLAELDSSVQELEYGLTSVKKYLSRENESLEQAQVLLWFRRQLDSRRMLRWWERQKLQEAAKEQLQYVLQYMTSNLPAHLPQLETVEAPAAPEEKENAYVALAVFWQ